MSNRDPFEELLAGLNRPEQPRPEFAKALEHRLLAQFGTSESAGKGMSEMSQSVPASRSWPGSTEPEASSRRWLPVLEIAAVVLIALGIGATVLASRGMLPGQSNDNHAALQTEYPTTPGAEDCTVQPRTEEEVRALVPDFSQGFPTEQKPQATPPLMLQHHAADEETKREIEAAYREWAACNNARDALRVFALYTDDFLRTGSVSLDELENTSEPVSQGDRVTILDVSYAREFDDGRAGAVVVVSTANAPAAITPLFFVFEKVGDRWLIDGLPMWWASAVGDSDVETVDGEELMTPTSIGAEVIEITPTAVPNVEVIVPPTVVQMPTMTPDS